MVRLSRIAPEPDFSRPRELIDMMTSKIRNPSKRDMQIKIGPSGIGDPCDHCVAELMNVKHQRDKGRHVAPVLSGNLAAWNGTAIHFFLEHLFVGVEWDSIGYEHESRMYIGNIPGYGDITGSADAYSSKHATVVDFKTSTLAKIRSYKLHGVGQTYDCQRQLYGRGKELQGKPIEYVVNLYIPRDGNSFNDIWASYALYDPDLAERALRRAATIWNEYVLTDNIDELGSDDDCFTCNRFDSVPANPIIRGRNGK